MGTWRLSQHPPQAYSGRSRLIRLAFQPPINAPRRIQIPAGHSNRRQPSHLQYVDQNRSPRYGQLVKIQIHQIKTITLNPSDYILIDSLANASAIEKLHEVLTHSIKLNPPMNKTTDCLRTGREILLTTAPIINVLQNLVIHMDVNALHDPLRGARCAFLPLTGPNGKHICKHIRHTLRLIPTSLEHESKSP